MKYFKKLIGERIYLSPRNNEDIEKCLAVGMNAHCSKPIDIEKLMKIIGKYLK